MKKIIRNLLPARRQPLVPDGDLTILALPAAPFHAAAPRTQQILRAFAEAGANVIVLEPPSLSTAPSRFSLFTKPLPRNLRVFPSGTDVRPLLTGRFLLWTDDLAQHRNLNLIRPQLVLFDSDGRLEAPDFRAMTAAADLMFVADRTLLPYHDARASVLDPRLPQTVADAFTRIRQTPNRKAPLM